VQSGHVLGRYELLVPIAAGGMAQVWAARMRGARQFQKIVAVKTMLPKLSEDEQFEQMFLDEASLASQIRHPNVVEIMDLGEHAGVLYLVMEWIEGVPLNQLMKSAKKNGGVPTSVATRIALQASAGLHAAHELTDERGALVGLVHRDVSPQNILVTYDGVTKVVDFGVAKATALGGGATVAGQIKGKVGYMAPEQVKGEGLDRRVDVFAMGIVLYALTTGKHPFRRESEAATMYNICAPTPVMAPSKVVPDYPPELEPIVLKALAKDVSERYSSCDELLRALDALPAHLRASSDADVAVFVRSLFGERREESRRQLEAAIERANTMQASGAAAFNTTEPVSSVMAGGGRRPMASMTATGELSGIPTMVRPARSKWIGIGAVVGLAVLGAIVFQVLNKGGSQTRDADLQVIEAPAVPKPDRPASVEAPAAPPAAPTTEPAKAAEPAPADPVEATPKSTAPKSTSTKPKSSSTTSSTTSKPPATTSKPKNWKYDAGF
jgi:serine/threonine-protein kinase